MRQRQGRQIIRRAACLLAAWVLLLPLLAAAENGTARFGRKGKPLTWPLVYQDAFFDGPGSSYHQGLATASLGLALSAFRKADVALEHSHDNVAALFLELGFTDPLFSQYNRQPTIHTIATAIAKKQLAQHTLVAVAISGGGYQDEWQSNFSIGDSLHHLGFDNAAQQVMQRITAYLSQHRLHNQPIKIWVTGFSRAAATANRVGALLLDQRVVAGENLYAYTFATPNVTRQENAASYPSIFNVVGAFDPVPMVPFADWGFLRYGTTFILPAPGLNSDYLMRVAPVAQAFQRQTGSPFWSNASGISAVTKLLSSLSESVTSTEEYTKKIQPLLMDLWAIRKQPLGMLRALLRHSIRRGSSLREVMGDAFAIASNSLGESLMQQEGLYQNQWQPGQSLTDNLAREHFPEGYMAWLSAYDSKERMVSPVSRYRQLTLQGFDDIQVKTAAGEDFFYYRLSDKGEFEQSAAGALWFSQIGDEMVLSLPADLPYTLHLKVGRADLVDLAIKEGQAGKTRMQVYQLEPGPLPNGSRWQVELPALSGSTAPGSASYQLTGEGGSHPLAYQAQAAALSANEMNSSFATMLTQNLVIGILVLVGVLLLLLFALMMIIRAQRRHHHKKLHRRQGQPLERASFKGNFWGSGQPGKLPLKLTSLLLMAGSLTLGVLLLRMTAEWLQEVRLIQQKTLFFITLLYYLPFGVLLLCCTLPGLGAGLYTLLWLKDLYVLRTGRLYARLALLFTLGLCAILLLPAYRYFSLTLLVTAPMQLFLLLLALLLMRRCLRAGRRKKGEGKHLTTA